MAITTTESSYNYIQYAADGSATVFPITFEYLDTAHVRVSVDGIAKTQGSDFTVANDEVTFSVAPSNEAQVKLWRFTKKDAMYNDFPNGGVLTGNDLNQNYDQLLYWLQELQSDLQTAGIATGSPPGSGTTPSEVTIPDPTGTDPIDTGLPGLNASTLFVFLNGQLLSTDNYTIDSVAGTITFDPELETGDRVEIRVSGSSTVTTVENGAITNGSLADDSVDSRILADGAVTWGALASGGFTTWGAITDATGPQSLLSDLNTRVSTNTSSIATNTAAIAALPSGGVTGVALASSSGGTVTPATTLALTGSTPTHVLVGCGTSTDEWILVPQGGSRKMARTIGTNIEISLSGKTVSQSPTSTAVLRYAVGVTV